MITVVSGPPGAGKTFFTCRRIKQFALEGRFVATNVLLVPDWAERLARDNPGRRLRGRAAVASKARELRSRMVYVESIAELASLRLDISGWEKSPEGRGKAIFDEAGGALDSRKWKADDREAANTFLMQHRKLGWDVDLIAQDLAMIDSRARSLAEFEVALRNLKHYEASFLGFQVPIFRLFGDRFVARWHWRSLGGRQGETMKREWFGLEKSTRALYDTNQIVHDVNEGATVLLPVADAPDTGMLTARQLLDGVTLHPQAVPASEARAPLPIAVDPAEHLPDAHSPVQEPKAVSGAGIARRAPGAAEGASDATVGHPTPHGTTDLRSPSSKTAVAVPSGWRGSVPGAVTATSPEKQETPGGHPASPTTGPAVPGADAQSAE